MYRGRISCGVRARVVQLVGGAFVRFSVFLCSYFSWSLCILISDWAGCGVMVFSVFALKVCRLYGCIESSCFRRICDLSYFILRILYIAINNIY